MLENDTNPDEPEDWRELLEEFMLVQPILDDDTNSDEPEDWPERHELLEELMLEEFMSVESILDNDTEPRPRMTRHLNDPISEWVLDELLTTALTPAEPTREEQGSLYQAGIVTPWLRWEPEVPDPGGLDG